MRGHYKKVVEFFDIEEATEILLEQGDIIFCNYENDLENIIAKFYRVNFHTQLIEKDMLQLSKSSGVPYYTVCFIVLASASKFMLEDYKRAKISLDVFWDTIEDLKYKLIECKKVKGVWGNFVIFWYGIFYNLSLFKLGRLEFERTIYHGKTISLGSTQLKSGDRVYSVHIPSSGKLTKESRMESYKKAYDYFEEERNGEPMICICDSWLLYPKNRDIFPSNLNIIDFLNEWNIIESEEVDDFEEAWRVFDKEYQSGQMPTDNIQQKSLVDWIESGHKTGTGLGVMVFDGELILQDK